MTRCVLDCSVAIAWCYEDEATPETDAILDEVARHGAVVPTLWAAELANTPQGGLKRKRTDAPRLDAVLARLARLRIRVVDPGGEHPARVAGRLRERAGQSGLTAYDQCYLDLAIAEALPLATLDTALRRAAQAERVTLLPAPAPAA